MAPLLSLPSSSAPERFWAAPAWTVQHEESGTRVRSKAPPAVLERGQCQAPGQPAQGCLSCRSTLPRAVILLRLGR